MPNLDGKGPSLGTGPKSAGQRGNCEGAKPRKRPFDGRGAGLGRRDGSRGLGRRKNKRFGLTRGKG